MCVRAAGAGVLQAFQHRKVRCKTATNTTISKEERERDDATLNSSWCVIGCLRLSRCYPLEIVDLNRIPSLGCSQARQCSAR